MKIGVDATTGRGLAGAGSRHRHPPAVCRDGRVLVDGERLGSRVTP